MNYKPSKTYLLIEYPYNINFIFENETIIINNRNCLIPDYIWQNFVDNITNDNEYFDERQYVIVKDNEIDDKLTNDYESDDSL